MATQNSFELKRFSVREARQGTQVLSYLEEHGVAVIESMLTPKELERYRNDLDEIMARERDVPFDPGDGPECPDDAAMEAYLAKSYRINEAELARMMKRIRHTRAQNHGTPWPVEATRVNHSFLHVPTLLDEEKSQRVFNLPAKLPYCGRMIEDPVVLGLLGEMLGEDFVLSDIASASIGPHTDGGYWHVDGALTVLPDPLPDAVLAMQMVWLLDDFTEDNGATRILPGSHRLFKKPPWEYKSMEGEVALTAPAGSVAIWLSHSWHKVGQNVTDHPRRAIIGYYTQAWIKPFSDYTRSLPAEVIETYSPRARYLLGWSAFGPKRG